MLDRLRDRGALSRDQFVDACLELLGPLRVSETTRASLLRFAAAGGPLDLAGGGEAAEQRVAEVFQLIAATREFQLV